MASVPKQPNPYFPRSISDDLEVPILYDDQSTDYCTENRPNLPNDLTEPKTSHVKSIVATLLAGIGSLCFGFCLGYSSPALQDLKHKDSSLHLDDVQGAFFAVSIFYSFNL